jgi:hypothetical protein
MPFEHDHGGDFRHAGRRRDLVADRFDPRDRRGFGAQHDVMLSGDGMDLAKSRNSPQSGNHHGAGLSGIQLQQQMGDLRLRRLGAQSVVVFGITTDMCVSTTVCVGANLGWRMVLVHDACDCCDLLSVMTGGIIPARDVHDAHVATLAAEFCTAVSTRDILQH